MGRAAAGACSSGGTEGLKELSHHCCPTPRSQGEVSTSGPAPAGQPVGDPGGHRGELSKQGARSGRDVGLFEQPLKPCKGAIKAGRTVGAVRSCLLCKGVTQTSVFRQKCASQSDGVRLSPLCEAAPGLPFSPLISGLLLGSQAQHPLQLCPKANCKFRPCLGGRANPHKTSEWKQKCVLLKKKKKEKEREKKK